MMTDTPPCCSLCKGTAPHMFCRSGSCLCHSTARQKQSGRELYRDPVAEQAIGRTMRDRNGIGYQGRPIYLKGTRR